MKFGFSASNTPLCEYHISNEQQQETNVRMNLDNNFRIENTKSGESHQEGSEEEEELRKHRKGERKVVKSVEQLELLKNFYEENPLPTPCTYQRIAVQTGLTARFQLRHYLYSCFFLLPLKSKA